MTPRHDVGHSPKNGQNKRSRDNQASGHACATSSKGKTPLWGSREEQKFSASKRPTGRVCDLGLKKRTGAMCGTCAERKGEQRKLNLKTASAEGVGGRKDDVALPGETQLKPDMGSFAFKRTGNFAEKHWETRRGKNERESWGFRKTKKNRNKRHMAVIQNFETI